MRSWETDLAAGLGSVAALALAFVVKRGIEYLWQQNTGLGQSRAGSGFQLKDVPHEEQRELDRRSTDD